MQEYLNDTYDRNGFKVRNFDGCRYSRELVIVDGELHLVVNCEWHGHGGMEKRANA